MAICNSKLLNRLGDEMGYYNSASITILKVELHLQVRICKIHGQNRLDIIHHMDIFIRQGFHSQV